MNARRPRVLPDLGGRGHSDVDASLQPHHGRTRSTGLPLPTVARREDAVSLLLAVSAIDGHGRLAAARILGALGWSPGQAVSFTVTADLVVLVRPPGASTGWLCLRRTVAPDGRLILPAAVRHRIGIVRGERLLLAADEHSQVLRIYSPRVLAVLLPRHGDAP